MSIGQRIKELRKKSGLTQVQLGELVQKSSQVISNWERSYTNDIASKDIARLAQIFGVSADYLTAEPFAGQEPGTFLKFADQIGMKKVPIIGTIACGTPILAAQNIDGYAVTTNPAVDFALRAKGDSMINKRIHDGDLVFIRKQSDVEDGDVAAVLVNNEATLKIVRRANDSVMLCPANDNYPPMIFHKGDVDSFRILGKAVKVEFDC